MKRILGNILYSIYKKLLSDPSLIALKFQDIKPINNNPKITLCLFINKNQESYPFKRLPKNSSPLITTDLKSKSLTP